MATNTETLLTIFVALTGVAVLLQACVLFAIFVSLRKTAQSVKDVTEDFRATVLPAVHSSRDLLDRITPQVVTISAGLAELTETLKKESHGVTFSAAEIMQRVSRQTERLDKMLTSTLDAVDRAGVVVESTVAAPVRQMNGIIAAIKAVIGTYRSETPRSKSRYAATENDPGL